MDTEALEGLGLTRNESIVYVTLLELGKSHIGEISKKTKMHRRTIYDCLERLIDRGLVRFVIENKIRFFSAESPDKFREIIKEKKEKLESILPGLFSIEKNPNEKTRIFVYQGKEGIKSIMDNLIKEKPKIWYSLTSAAKGKNILPFYLENFHRMREKIGIGLRIIFGKNLPSEERAKELLKYKRTDVKFIDSEYLSPISSWIYNNKIIFILWDSQTGILIEDNGAAESFRNYFELLWKIAK